MSKEKKDVIEYVMYGSIVLVVLIGIFMLAFAITNTNNYNACSEQDQDCTEIYDCKMKYSTSGSDREQAIQDFQVCMYKETGLITNIA